MQRSCIYVFRCVPEDVVPINHSLLSSVRTARLALARLRIITEVEFLAVNCCMLSRVVLSGKCITSRSELLRSALKWQPPLSKTA